MFQSNIPVHRLRNQITWHVVSDFDARGLRAPKFQHFTLPSLQAVKPTANCTCICVTVTRLKPSVLWCSLQSPFSLRSALSPRLVLRQQLSLIKCVRTLWEHLVLLWRWSNGTSISVAVCVAYCYFEQLLQSSGKMNSGFAFRDPSEPHFASSFSEEILTPQHFVGIQSRRKWDVEVQSLCPQKVVLLLTYGTHLNWSKLLNCMRTVCYTEAAESRLMDGWGLRARGFPPLLIWCFSLVCINGPIRMWVVYHDDPVITKNFHVKKVFWRTEKKLRRA